MPTSVRTSIALVFASDFDQPKFVTTFSVRKSPTLRTGLIADLGSWKIIATCEDRYCISLSRSIAETSSP